MAGISISEDDTATERALVKGSIASICGDELTDCLLDEYDELMRRYHLRDFRPSELSGGRFAEAVFRICEIAVFGSHTEIGKQLPRVDVLVRRFETSPAGMCDDTFRLHIPRALRLLYDLRNKRDVAHLGTAVSPSFTDSSLTIGVASWVMSECVRVFHNCDISLAQAIVDSLMQRQLPLIWESGDAVRVLNPDLDYSEQVLLVLYHFQPAAVSDDDLIRWLGYANRSEFRSKVLRGLHKEALIHYDGGQALILPPAIKLVEEYISQKTNF